MKASRTSFTIKLQELEEYLQNKQKTFKEDSQRQVTIEKKYSYRIGIITLYAIFEDFIRDSFNEYLQIIRSVILKYSDLPEKLRNHHERLTAESMARIRQDNEAESEIFKELVNNLVNCLNDIEEYKLNSNPFSYSNVNLRGSQVQQMAKQLDIAQLFRKLQETEEYNEYIKLPYSIITVPSSPDEIQEIIFRELEDIVERRNQVSHGEVDELLSVEILLEKKEFIKMIGEGICSVMKLEAYKYFIMNDKCLSLGKPIVVYNHDIVCINNNHGEIKLGDLLITESDSSLVPYIASAIEEIQVENVSHEKIDSTKSIDIGIKIGHKTNDKHSVFIFPS